MRSLLSILFLFLADTALAQCRHALILALDVSASVTWSEYRMQQIGLADALRDEEVVDLILFDPDRPVSLLAFEWAGQTGQNLITDWSLLRSRADVLALADRIEAFQGSRRSFRTATGSALNFSHDQFKRGPICDRRTIDVSSDGKSNIGVKPKEIYATGAFDSIIVNTLSIGDALYEKGAFQQNLEMFEYFQSQVNHGPGSFTIEARGIADFSNAMKRKLIRELSPLQLAQYDVMTPLNLSFYE